MGGSKFFIRVMIELSKDKKSETYIITRTDSEGFHHQLNITQSEMEKLRDLITLAQEAERALRKA